MLEAGKRQFRIERLRRGAAREEVQKLMKTVPALEADAAQIEAELNDVDGGSFQWGRQRIRGVSQ